MTTERWTDEMLDKLAESVKEIGHKTDQNAEAIRELRQESKEQGIRFEAHKQASQ